MIKTFEEEDPYALVGLGFQNPEGFDGIGSMARTFIEEFALLGYDRTMIAKLFVNPWYQAPHAVLLARGNAYVQSLLDEVFGPIEQGDNENA